MFLELPQGIKIQNGNSKDHVFQPTQIYMVRSKLAEFVMPSLIDECVFYKDDVIFIVYVDHSIFIGKDDSKITHLIQQMGDTHLDIEDQGHPADYVGINIKQSRDRAFELTQSALINTNIE
ncbi:hypothetical protein ACHAW6_006784 [Cyclotella cf. meneghiniana]